MLKMTKKELSSCHLFAFIRGPRAVGWLICPASSTMHQSKSTFKRECLEADRAVQQTRRVLSAMLWREEIVPTLPVSRRYLVDEGDDEEGAG